VSPSSVEAIGHGVFEALARAFPVACSSDELYYFPQVRAAEPQWSAWDRFSSETVAELARDLSAREHELEQIDRPQSDPELQADINLLQGLVRTLREQLSELRSWEFQPSLYLTLACIGLAEAIQSENPAAKHERAGGLHLFLDQAGRNLNRVPVLFRDIGLEMVLDTRDYFLLLSKTLPELRTALAALDRFEQRLKSVSTRQDFRLPQEMAERVFRCHIGCGLDLEQIGRVLDREESEMRQVLEQEAAGLAPAKGRTQTAPGPWLEVLQSIRGPSIGKGGAIELFRNEVAAMSRHCLEQGLVQKELFLSCPVGVEPMPDFLSAIRSGASYSIPPRHPPRGGTFHIARQVGAGARTGFLREYRMTCAHEAYPGHHLLDASRLSLLQPLRRAIERPIFYEGWACFAEEIMRLTGYFSQRYDRLLLARRRLTHAARARVDVGLQTGTMSRQQAAACLQSTGVSGERAVSLARNYTLNPGYQLCYTLGLRRFLELFEHYGRDKLPGFVRTVLSQGEIHFADLADVLGRNAD